MQASPACAPLLSSPVPSLPFLGHALELSAAGLFAWCWAAAPRERPGLRAELCLAATYGWLLEALDMWIFGTYHYGGALRLWLPGRVPLSIPLLWAIIIQSSMALSDLAGLPDWSRPFLDGLLAVLIDLGVDAIAIRAGLWTWGIPLTEGWFGVPAGNLYAWMWVAAWYSGVLRLVRARIMRGEPSWHRWLAPPVAYAGLLWTFVVLGYLGLALELRTQGERLWLFAAHVAVCAALVAAAARRCRPAGLPRLAASLRVARWLMHGSFALLALWLGLWRATPALLAVSAGALTAEWAVQRWCEQPAGAA